MPKKLIKGREGGRKKRRQHRLRSLAMKALEEGGGRREGKKGKRKRRKRKRKRRRR